MNPESEEPIFEYLGYYRPDDARRLLSALEAANIKFDAKFFDGIKSMSSLSGAHGGHFGGGAQILISIDSNRNAEVQQIHKEMFGDCLPDYDSSFFTDHPPDTPPTGETFDDDKLLEPEQRPSNQESQIPLKVTLSVGVVSFVLYRTAGHSYGYLFAIAGAIALAFSLAMQKRK